MFCLFPLSKSVKSVLIIHLCLAFSLLLYFLLAPFFIPYYETRSDLLLIEAFMGKTDGVKALDASLAKTFQSKREVQAALFEALPHEEQDKVRALLSKKLMILQENGGDSLKRGAKIIMTAPPLDLLWLFLSLFAPIALLLHKPIGQKALWLLPLVTLLFAIYHIREASPLNKFSDSTLFPTEKELIDEPLQGSILEQKEALEIAYQNFLIKKHLNEAPSQDMKIRDHQIAASEFHFLRKRVENLKNKPSNPFWNRVSAFTLLLYLSWNLFFALYISLKLQNRAVYK